MTSSDPKPEPVSLPIGSAPESPASDGPAVAGAAVGTDAGLSRPTVDGLGPTCRERGSEPTWTLVGTLDGAAPARVDGAGLVTPHGASWSLDWWIGADDRWYLPAQEPTVRQDRDGPGPVLNTRVRIPSGDARQRVYGAVVDGREATVIEIENDSPVPVALALAVRPYTVDGTVSGPLALAHAGPALTVDGLPIGLPRAPNEAAASAEVDLVDVVRAGGDLVWKAAAPTGPDGSPPPSGPGTNAVVLYPLPHRTSLRFVVPAPSAVDPGVARAPDPATAPEPAAVVRGWAAVVEGAMRVELPDDGLGALLGAARARLVAGTGDERLAAVDDLSPGAGAVLEALARTGHRAELAPLLDALTRSFPTRLPSGPESGADMVAALGPALVTLGHEPPPELLEVGAQLTHLVERAKVADATARARRGLAGLARMAGDVDGRRHLLRDVDPAPGPDYDALVALALTAGEAQSWGRDELDPAARYVLGTLALLIDDAGDDLLLLPHYPAAWRGGGLEVHRAPTAHGELSFGIRWHGARPALLWQLDPNPASSRTTAGERPVRLRCPGLDPDWSTTEPRGETLLAGTAEGLAAVPGPGDGFR